MKVDYISLVNLIMQQEVVKELIQHELTVKNIQAELDLIIEDKSDKRQKMLQDYTQMQELLGGGGASEKVAQLLLQN